MVQKILIVGAVIVLIVAGGVWSIFRMTAPAAEAATHFVIIAGSAGPAAAYAETAPALRAAMPEAVFEVKLNQLGLTRAKSASWSSRSLNGAGATMSGTAKLASGDVTPLTIQLVKSNGRWLVSDLAYGQVSPVDQ